MNGRNGVTQLFEELEVECGASVECITDRVSVLQGVDIEVELLGEGEWACIAPFVLVSGDRARILLRESDPRWYRLHAVIHQLSHLLCGHTQCAALPMSFEGSPDPTSADRLTHELLHRQEAEAEEISRRLSAFVLAADSAPSRALLV
ncbi:hypothetical protein [Microbacterium sp. J1-1]|uniref:hypothetical protein n=1 Tax=Microbacterium sp. J1-1 TaxID=2992441 RepID=UPI002114077F|nr:hypothetical protein [Microbacterium sp. J1-1]UUE20589.1 hypothetical protein LRQ07_17660 [Microbacterium sp. J1-1]